MIAYQFSRYPWIEEWRSFTVIYNLSGQILSGDPHATPKSICVSFFEGFIRIMKLSDVEITLLSCPGARCESLIDRIAMNSNYKEYDVLYYSAGINDLSVKIKGHNVIPRFNNSDDIVQHLNGQYLAALHRLEPVARKVVLCELLGVSIFRTDHFQDK